MLLYAGQVDQKVYDDLKKEYNIKLLESELDILMSSNEMAQKNLYTVMLFQNPSATRLNNFVINPCNAFIELENKFERNKTLISNLNQDKKFYLSLRAATIYKIPVAHIIGRALGRKIHLNEIIRDKLITGLHEALLEVIITGCFEIKETIDDLHGFNDYLQYVEDRQKDETFGNRRVGIEIKWDEDKVTTNITHEGCPCEMQEEVNKTVFSPSLQRIQMVKKFAHSFEVENNGFLLTLHFSKTL